MATVPPQAAPETQQLDPLVEEVRVAMALNGGVSLAVWMGGCATELDAARRAHLGRESVATDGEPAPERRVYNALVRAFRQEFVVDIMSGASAGGINGALLAAAMRKGRRLHPRFLRDRWLELGDFAGNLLHPTTVTAPRSLLRGDAFLEAMEEAFAVLLGERPPPAGEDDLSQPEGQAVRPFDPVLDITMTDVTGEPRSFLDVWGKELVAREHRATFKFRRDEHFTTSRLAPAARATASFPAAFEPTLVSGDAASLTGQNEARWAVDGGLLNNAPIRVAIGHIPMRKARRRVRRFVCYVNAHPPRLTEASAEEPALPAVLGHVVNLPRNAPFADELAAAERAVREGVFSSTAQQGLLDVERDELTAVAAALLPAYRDRRQLRSLEELAGDAALGRTIFERLGPRDLPWIPGSMAPPASASEWRWGLRTAQRAVQLQLDVLRDALAGLSGGPCERVLTAWTVANEEFDRLEAAHRRFAERPELGALVRALAADDDPSGELAALEALVDEVRPVVFGALERATGAILDVAGDLPPEALRRLFGDERSPAAALRGFLQGALAIEVVRRAFSDEEDFQTGQNLAFAQLTPVVPILAWTSTPFRGASGDHLPDSPNKKLTGIILGHFGAFYRRSWRANDFMWGRLDAATRIVDMLVDPGRARQVAESEPWGALAAELVTADTELADAQRALVHEALADARAPADELDPAVTAALTAYPDGQPPADELLGHLTAALRADLSATSEAAGSLTRVVLARAVQLEIIRHELPILQRETESDAELGCFVRPVELLREGDEAGALDRLRACPPLPLLLGRESGDESVSNLALRSISHAAFVALLLLRTLNPLARVLAIARAPLLPISGIASRGFGRKLVVAGGYAAAALYVAARLTSAEPRGAVPLGDLWSRPVLLELAALLAMVGVLVVPLLRGLRARAEPWAPESEAAARRRRRRQWSWAAALAVTGLVVPLLLAGVGEVRGLAIGRDLGFAGVLAAPGELARPAPWLTALALVAVLGVPAARPLARFGGVAARLLPRGPRNHLTVLTIAAAAALVGGWAVWRLAGVLTGDPSWQQLVIAGSAALSSLVALGYVFRAKHR